MFTITNNKRDVNMNVLSANTLALPRRGGVGVDGGDGALDAVPHRQQRAAHARLGLNVGRYS